MQIRARYPSVLLMADIATIDEAVTAERLGFDCVGTTLYGYTADTAGHVLAENDCGFYVRYWRRSAYLSWQKETSILRNVPHDAWN